MYKPSEVQIDINFYAHDYNLKGILNNLIRGKEILIILIRGWAFIPRDLLQEFYVLSMFLPQSQLISGIPKTQLLKCYFLPSKIFKFDYDAYVYERI